MARKGRPVSGFLIVDKPPGLGSTAVVNKVRWTMRAQKAGHAGTLDPAATGLLAVALGAEIAGGFAGALLILLIGTLFGIVTFGVLTANLALKSKDPAAVQAIFPMAYLLIFLTSAYQQPEQIDSPVMRTIVDANPAEHVLQPMRELMLSGYDWSSIGLGFAVIIALGLIGIPLTVRNYRSVYR